MHDITVTTESEVQIQPETTMEISVGVDDVKVNIEKSGQVDIDPAEYYLTSSGLYTGRLTGSIPTWLYKALQDELANGTVADNFTQLYGLINLLELGVNQNTSQIQTNEQSLSALETSLLSRFDTNEAAILDIQTTKVTAAEAQTIALTLQQSTFGLDVDAYITNLAATYTDQNSAVAQDVDMLVTSVNGVSASVSQISVVSVEDGLAHAKNSLIVDANGNISGYVAESGETADFTIFADNFKIANGTNPGIVPFEVDTVNSIVNFIGVVNFAASNAAYGYEGTSTKINGGLIETNTINAEQINTQGLIAEDIYNSNFYGKNIYGAYIEGAVIKASYLDLSGEIQILTDYHLWVSQVDMDAGIAAGQKGELYTNEVDMPGAIYVSGQDEWRLPSTSIVKSYEHSDWMPTVFDDTCANDYKVVTGQMLYQDDIFGAFDSYEIQTSLRLVKDKPTISVNTSTKLTFKSYDSRYSSFSTLQSIMDYYHRFFNISLGTFSAVWEESDQFKATFNGVTLSVDATPSNLMLYTDSTTATINGIRVTAVIQSQQYGGTFITPYVVKRIWLELDTGDHIPTVDLTGIGGISIEYTGATTCGGSSGGYSSHSFPEIEINNMV